MEQKAFDLIVREHLETLSDEYLNEKIKDFKNKSFVTLSELLPVSLKKELENEAKILIKKYQNRRDLKIKVTGDSPRYFYNVNRDTIRKYGDIIPVFFSSDVVLDFLTKINNGESVHRIPYQPEEYIINSQQASGDTHGWHWDDYSYALIWVVEAPSLNEGGLLEYVPNTNWDKNDYKNCVKNVLGELEENQIQSAFIPEGTCYFMKAGKTLHRVTPLLKDSRRTVIVFSYASNEDLTRDITHETMEEIYG